MLDRVADVLRELLFATPPDRSGKVHRRRALLDAWKVARRFRALDLAGRRDVLDLFTKSAGDVLDRWFESAPIKAAFGFDAIVGNFASPYTPGIRLRAAAPRIRRGQRQARPVGPCDRRHGRDHAGDGEGMRRSRRDPRVSAPVERVVVKAGRAAGVRARRRRSGRSAGASSPTSIRSSCSSGSWRPSTSTPIFARALPPTAAGPARSG